MPSPVAKRSDEADDRRSSGQPSFRVQRAAWRHRRASNGRRRCRSRRRGRGFVEPVPFDDLSPRAFAIADHHASAAKGTLLGGDIRWCVNACFARRDGEAATVGANAACR
jgi:hypothetical protein